MISWKLFDIGAYSKLWFKETDIATSGTQFIFITEFE